MRVKPEINEDIKLRNLLLTRWDKWSDIDPRKCCKNCKHFNFNQKKCTEEYHIKNQYNIDLKAIDIDVYSCGDREIEERFLNYFVENPYKDLEFWENREKAKILLDSLAKEIDIDIHFSQRSKILWIKMNSVLPLKAQFLKTKIKLSGFVIKEKEVFSEYVDNKLAERKITEITINNPKAIENITVYQDGHISFMKLDKFIDFINLKKNEKLMENAQK